MSPDQPGVAAPSDPAATSGEPTGRPTFRPDVEQVAAPAADPPAAAEPTGAPAATPTPAPPERAAHVKPKAAPPTRRRLLDDPDPDAPKGPRPARVRARKVHRIVRHIEPWSVLKISVLFFLSLFLIICVASAVLWNAARGAGVIDDIEGGITTLAAVGECVDIDGDTATTPETTPSTIDGAAEQVGGVGEGTPSTVATVPEPDETSNLPDEDGECAEGQRLVGGFKFEDQRIFQAFGLGGVVLVLAGAAASVVMAMLFNLISDLTGGVRVTVLEEEPVRVRTGSPPSPDRD
jgi:hypothetical protein